MDICDRQAVITQTVQAGELDLATPSGRMMARTLGAFARFEVEHKSERTKRAQAQAAAAGKWLGGARPFGWTLHGPGGKPTVNRAEAREVRNACKAILAGQSLGSIVDDLNARGVTTSTGRQWNYTSVRQVVTRARNAGLTEYNGEIIAQSVMPALVTEDVWRGVCAVLSDPSRRRSQSNRARWLLAGLAVCGTCSTRLKSAAAGAPGRSSRTVYRCPTRGSGHVARSARSLDDYVSEIVIARLSRDDAKAALVASPPDGTADNATLRTDAVALRGRLGEAADAFAAGAITSGQLVKITKQLRDRLGEIEGQMSRNDRSGVLAGFVGGRDARQVWNALDIERRRAVVEALMKVTVQPGLRGREFDPELIDVEWRSA